MMKKRRIMCLIGNLIFTCMLFSSVLPVNAENSVDSEYDNEKDYYFYDYNESIDDIGIVEYKIHESSEINSIIGTDDRVKVSNTKIAPYKSIVYLNVIINGNQAAGTGTLIDNTTVLTAAHVVYNVETNTWASSVTVYPGKNKETEPYGSTTASKIVIYPGYNSTGSYIPKYDLAIIKLNKPLGVKTGYLSISSSISTGNNVSISGYPIDLSSGYNSPSMYRGDGAVTSITSDFIKYNVDTSGGQSGSAVLNSSNNIVGVHIKADGNNNTGVRMTTQKINWINSYKDSKYVPVYRLYNPNNGEHFFTKNANETVSLENSGWSYDGVAWFTPNSGIPVYRLYDSSHGIHLYTSNVTEKNTLVIAGWTNEGIAWYSATSGKSVYRLYKSVGGVGLHMLTSNTTEKNNLISAGWTYEGVSMYGLQ